MNDPAYWALALAALVAAGSIAFMRKIGMLHLISILAAWSGSIGSIMLLHGILPSIVAATVSMFAGALLFAISLVRSGIASMPNRRYEER